MVTKRRGRTRNSANPKTAAADLVIGQTVFSLSCWGVPFRTSAKAVGAFEIVGLRARKVLHRFDHDEKPLGPDRVEQIFESWFSTENAARRGGGKWPLLKRSRYIRESLRETVPLEARRLSIEKVVDLLLENGGKSPWESPRYTGDLQLSPKEYENKGELNDRAVRGLVRRMMHLWIERHGPISERKAEILSQVFVRDIAVAYHADLIGNAPDSLKNRVEK
jgi:hypothetical protein